MWPLPITLIFNFNKTMVFFFKLKKPLHFYYDETNLFVAPYSVLCTAVLEFERITWLIFVLHSGCAAEAQALSTDF